MDNKTPEKQNGVAPKPSRNLIVATGVAFVAVGMLGMAYAAVPLYRMFCQVTGYAGTTQRALKPSQTVLDQEITIRFDANIRDLAWDFEPVQRTMKVKIGENALAFYRAKSLSDHVTTGSATFNVAPMVVGSFFNKVACFCFTEQTLKAGETVDMPVSFYVDPAIVKDKDGRVVSEITLSYTFYPVDKPKQQVRAKAPGLEAEGKGG